MFKAEWDCQPVMDEIEQEVQKYDKLSDTHALSADEMVRWVDLVTVITAYTNLKEGLDP